MFKDEQPYRYLANLSNITDSLQGMGSYVGSYHNIFKDSRLCCAKTLLVGSEMGVDVKKD